MQVGELVKLAKWCSNGPALMQVIETGGLYIMAIYLEGPRTGEISNVAPENLFSLHVYDEEMKKHYACR